MVLGGSAASDGAVSAIAGAVVDASELAGATATGCGAQLATHSTTVACRDLMHEVYPTRAVQAMVRVVSFREAVVRLAQTRVSRYDSRT